jgi:hypothetical protein
MIKSFGKLREASCRLSLTSGMPSGNASSNAPDGFHAAAGASRATFPTALRVE